MGFPAWGGRRIQRQTIIHRSGSKWIMPKQVLPTGSDRRWQDCGFARGGWCGRSFAALSDRGPSRVGFVSGRHDARLLAGELRPTRPLLWVTLSPGQSSDLRGAGPDIRAARLQCPKLAEPDGEAPRRSAAWPFLCDHSGQAAGDCRAPRNAADGERRGLSCLMTRDRITSNCSRPIALPTRENIAALMHL
jgi:hypothetical protein